MIDHAPDERAIFFAALERPAGPEREAFLRAACSGEPDLGSRVRLLFALHEQSHGPLDSPAPGLCITAAADGSLAEQPGTRIGPYKLLEQIGEGGFGVVFLAEQTEPVRRKVALKVLKPGMDTRQVVARFEAERQALAIMDHPNIAKILDAGMVGNAEVRDQKSEVGREQHPLTAPGLRPLTSDLRPLTSPAARPYFVMELVRGLPITEYCDHNRLTPRERLELFATVCHAVQHAHQKGLIHRDLKPSNVLVSRHDTTPIVKIIDFGVAKALGQSLTDKTLFTGIAQMIGTPLYMSPEQAGMSDLDVDTRSDIYSLGVLLYELLTGTTPFDKERLKSVGFDELRRIIREEEPETVSQRIGRTLSTQPGASTGAKFSRRVHATLPELDWIVMKALEKDRTRRYESASALAADIQRYLSDEPVLACPPTAMYRFQKFARKHKSLLTTGAAIATCLILGTTVSAWQAVRATTAEAKAIANEQKASANEAQAREAAAAEARQRRRAEANEQKATTERDEAERQRDEVKALNNKLQSTLYAAHMNLAQHAWDENVPSRTLELLDQHRTKPGEPDLRGFEWHYLYRQCHAELLTLRVSSDAVRSEYLSSVRYSPDGKRLITRTRRGVVKVWDAQSGQEMVASEQQPDLRDHSPDGKYRATPSWDQTANESTMKILDAQSGNELHTLTKQTGVVQGWRFSLDSKRLTSISARWDDQRRTFVPGELKMWEVATGQEIVSVKIAGVQLAYSPDGKRLAVACWGDLIRICDAESGLELLSIQSGGDGVAYSPDGKHLAGPASGPDEGTVLKIWDAATGKEMRTLPGHSGRQINGVAFSPDGKRLASAGGDRTAKVWDVETGEELFAFKGHDNMVRNAVFSPDGTRLASASMDGTVKVWDVAANPGARTLSGLSDVVDSTAFSPDGNRIAAGVGIGKWDPSKRAYPAAALKVWDTRTGQELFSIKGLTRVPVSFKFSPDGKRLAGTDDRTVKLWDGQTGQELFSVKGHTHLARNVEFSPDGKRLASTDDQTVKLWDAQTGQELRSLPGHTGRITTLVFSPDGKRVASASDDKTVKVWNTDTGQELLTFKGHSDEVNGLAFSADGKHIASTSRDANKVWDSETGRELHSLQGTEKLSGAAFSPDGMRLAGSRNVHPGGYGEVKVLDVQTGKELLSLKGHTAIVGSVVFSSDGKRLISAAGNPTGGNSGEVKIWDADSGLELLTIPGGSMGHRVALSTDSYHLASVHSGKLKIYDATPLPEKP